MQAFWTLIRVKHWVKNLFVFLPAFFALRAELLWSPPLWKLFLSFCLASSTVYVFNDLLDIEKDRAHPLKRLRPIASGQIDSSLAKRILGFLLMLSLLSCLWLQSWQYLLAYLALNLAYSLFLKNLPVIDVGCISLGFLLRILAGGEEVAIPISTWMILIVFLLTISIAWAKRRTDSLLIATSEQKGPVQFYGIAASIGLGLTFVAYVLYSIDPGTIARMGSDRIYYTAFFVFLGILRYLQLIFVENRTEDPTTILWQDRFLQIVLLGWMVSFAILIYG